MTEQMSRRRVIFEWLALIAIVASVSVTTFDTDIPHLWKATWVRRRAGSTISLTSP